MSSTAETSPCSRCSEPASVVWSEGYLRQPSSCSGCESTIFRWVVADWIGLQSTSHMRQRARVRGDDVAQILTSRELSLQSAYKAKDRINTETRQLRDFIERRVGARKEEVEKYMDSFKTMRSKACTEIAAE